MVELNFVCKDIPLRKIISCSFGLNKTDIDIFLLLIREKKEMSVNDIMKKMDKDKTTIQRSMKTISTQELVNRRQINLKKGGYIFIYSAASKNYLKERIYKNLDVFKNSISKEIEKW
jgi:predicted transcriptional regulator